MYLKHSFPSALKTGKQWKHPYYETSYLATHNSDSRRQENKMAYFFKWKLICTSNAKQSSNAIQVGSKLQVLL